MRIIIVALITGGVYVYRRNLPLQSVPLVAVGILLMLTAYIEASGQLQYDSVLFAVFGVVAVTVGSISMITSRATQTSNFFLFFLNS